MSWIIVRHSDGKAMYETWNPALALRVNLDHYKAVPAMEYLCELNNRTLLNWNA